MPALPPLKVISETEHLTIHRGYDAQRELNVYLHVHPDHQGRTMYTCYLTDRPAHDLTEAPATGSGTTPEAAFSNALGASTG